MEENELLKKLNAQLVSLGYEVEYRRDKVRRIGEMDTESNTHLLRATDNLKHAEDDYKELQNKVSALKSKIAVEGR